MDIKKLSGQPLPPPQRSLSTSKSDASPRLANTMPVPATATTQALWQSGQILQALVLKASPEQLLLNIQGAQASVARPPALPLQAGDKLQVKVIKNAPLLQLKLIEVQSATETITRRALRNNLPRQQTLPPLLANIEYLSRNPAATTQFDKAIRIAAQQIYYQLPGIESLRQPLALKQALELSGTFFESNIKASLQTGGLNLQQDTRTSLLRLSTQLQYYIASKTGMNRTAQAATARLTTESGTAIQSARTTISSSNPVAQAGVSPSLAQNPGQQAVPQSSLRAAEQLLQQTEGVLARLQIHQLHQLKSEENFRPSWSVELPVRTDQGINLFDLRIQREVPFSPPWTNEEGRQHQQVLSPRWSVRLAFDLEGLGPVQVVIGLQDEQVSVHFHAEDVQTNTLFNEYLATLGSRLRHAGLDVAGIDCQQGQPKPAAEIANTPLVDEQV
ncbi:hypothetical protein MNBD_GAMMA25-2480 [hydrothermal vent metagenome]|uniref:Flagellar hook-length control protein-like C-terminal domain-containing protein n=1 Tax=hydrothermal vent metagenome TaxID=652676 RepID=A0A3B1B988_9ZZZZ